MEVDSGIETHGLQHEYQILRCDVPRGTRCIRTAPEAADGGVKVTNSRIQGGESVRESHASRVVKVRTQRYLPQLSGDSREYPLHASRIPKSGRIRQRDLIGARLCGRDGGSADVPTGHNALERTAEGYRDSHLDDRAVLELRMLIAQTQNGFELREALSFRSPQIGMTETLSRRDDAYEPVDSRRQGAHRSARVRHQCGRDEIRLQSRMACHFLGIPELRDVLLGHEGTDFDLAQSRDHAAIDPFLLLRCRHEGADALQAIAQADFSHEDVLRKIALTG